ncbi:MAG: hypothetical protein LOX97_08830 [Sphingomonas sp.]|nr:hypothetical protein [Sphingomonas sp.]
MLSPKSPDETGGSELLFRLHRAHEELLGALEGLALLTRQFAPDPSLLGTARWNLSKANMHRRLVGAEILSHLLARASGADRVELLRLQDGDADLLALWTDHVRRWSPEEISADWEEYCGAARAMRLGLVARMTDERRIFHPLLRAGMSHAPWLTPSPWEARQSA